MIIFPVSFSKSEKLLKDMERLGIHESDLDESFARSGGPGGQNVNKVSTCVILKHLPTGLMVKAQQDRSQAMNRYHARRILCDRLDAQIHGDQSAEAKRIFKIKRQKRRRSKRAKDKMLAGKKIHGEKKALRRRVGAEE